MSNSNNYAHFFSRKQADATAEAHKAMALTPQEIIETLVAVAVLQSVQTSANSKMNAKALNAAMAPYAKTGNVMSALIEYDLGAKPSLFKEADSDREEFAEKESKRSTL